MNKIQRMIKYILPTPNTVIRKNERKIVLNGDSTKNIMATAQGSGATIHETSIKADYFFGSAQGGGATIIIKDSYVRNLDLSCHGGGATIIIQNTEFSMANFKTSGGGRKIILHQLKNPQNIINISKVGPVYCDHSDLAKDNDFFLIDQTECDFRKKFVIGALYQDELKYLENDLFHKAECEKCIKYHLSDEGQKTGCELLSHVVKKRSDALFAKYR